MPMTRNWTDEELMALPRDGFKRELVGGEIHVSPAGAPHGAVIMRLGARLTLHAERHGLGQVFDSSTGVRMPSGNLRVPDLTFVSARHLPRGIEPGFVRVVPDLVVEVLSPGDSEQEIAEKVREYLAAGVRLVWVIDPPRRRAVAYRGPDPAPPSAPVASLGESDMLRGEDVLPGFQCVLGEILGGD